VEAIMGENLLTPASRVARAEALCLYRLLGQDGSTLEELRELVSVPPAIGRALRTFTETHPEDACWIEAVLKFRSRVLQEFERLVRDGVPVLELPEIEEPELDAREETYAEARP
jgi:hypothetical protein